MNLTISKILVSSPRYYDLKPLCENNFTKRNRSVNKIVAKQQWLRLIRILNSNNIEIEMIEPQKKIPNMVFSSEIGFCLNNCIILANYYDLDLNKIERHLHYQSYFKDKGFKLIEMPYFFGGASDILYSHHKQHLWIGYDQRTSLKGAYYLSNLLEAHNLTINCLRLINPQFYHLNLCFCPFGGKYVMVYKNAFDAETYRLIVSIFGENNVINLLSDEATRLVANSLFINDISGKTGGYLIGNKFGHRLRNIINKLGIQCVDIPLSEFLVGGGSARSLILEIN